MPRQKVKRGWLVLSSVLILSSVLTLLWSSIGLGASPSSGPWLRDWRKLYFDTYLPLHAQVEEITIPAPKIKARVVKSASDETIDPVYLYTLADDQALRKLATTMARPGKSEALFSYLRTYIDKTKKSFDAAGQLVNQALRVRVTKGLYRLLNKNELSARNKSEHQRLVLMTEPLRADRRTLNGFLQELAPFFTNKQLLAIEKSLNEKTEIPIDRDLLPDFARRMVTKYLIHRGPNCFHASLAFQSPLLTRSNFFNIKREEGYHRAMINYDELWRTLQSNFYEVNPAASPIKYGDIFVFFDLPEEGIGQAVNFHWIRHTATYLFNGYTFSKASKSANSPYTVKNLGEEWQAWQKVAKNMAVKIFRLSSKNVKKRPPPDLVDWIY